MKKRIVKIKPVNKKVGWDYICLTDIEQIPTSVSDDDVAFSVSLVNRNYKGQVVIYDEVSM